MIVCGWSTLDVCNIITEPAVRWSEGKPLARPGLPQVREKNSLETLSQEKLAFWRKVRENWNGKLGPCDLTDIFHDEVGKICWKLPYPS